MFGYGCSMVAAHSSRYATISPVPHGELMFMVAVSSRFIMVLTDVLQFTCSTDTVGRGARGGKRGMKR